MASEAGAAASGGGGGGGGVAVAELAVLEKAFGVRAEERSWVAKDPSVFAENRARLLERLRVGALPADSATAHDVSTLERGATPKAGAWIVLQGGKQETRADSDHDVLFRQESSFLWTFGVQDPDCFGAIEVSTGRSVVFIPRLPPSYAVWFGRIKSPAEFAAEHGLDEGGYTEEVGAFLAARGAAQLLVLGGTNSDSGKSPARVEVDFAGEVDAELLSRALLEARVFKSEKEIGWMRQMNRATSEAHLALMRSVRPGMREDQLEAIYKFWVQFAQGARLDSYTWICGSGPNAAVLHYGHAGAPNDRIMRAGEWVLCDCGNEIHGYASDVTTTFPVAGVFSPEQAVVYEAVLHALNSVERAMRPGVQWSDMQTLAYRCILEKLHAAGLVVGDVDRAIQPDVNLGSIFMPHGLGHFLGLDTHDVGGYLPRGVERDARAGYKSLRTVRRLAPSMCITVEPGCYFVDCLLDAAAKDPVQAPFLNMPLIDAKFRGIGGVRLEDNVVIRDHGIENLTFVPRTIKDVQDACAGRIDSIRSIRQTPH